LQAFQLGVDPIARQVRGCIRGRQEKRVARDIAKMFHDSSRAKSMRGLPGMRGDFQDLTKGAKRVSSGLGGVIGAGVSNDDYP